MVGYFVQYPIPYRCNLHCGYCLSRRWHEIERSPETAFAVGDYLRWRDSHLSGRIRIRLAGGEPFCEDNAGLVFSIMDRCTAEGFDILTNGLFPAHALRGVIDRASRLDRIGFTYHRRGIRDNADANEMFRHNVMACRAAGIEVYVKELLWCDMLDEIMASKRRWESLCVCHQLWPYQHPIERMARLAEFESASAATGDYLHLLDPEAITADSKRGICECLRGWENIIIRHDGRVLGCWCDQKSVIGSVVAPQWARLGNEVAVRYSKSDSGWSPNMRVTKKRKPATEGKMTQIDLSKATTEEIQCAGWSAHELLIRQRRLVSDTESALSMIRDELKRRETQEQHGQPTIPVAQEARTDNAPGKEGTGRDENGNERTV